MIYIHLGLPKTGTTTIQSFFRKYASDKIIDIRHGAKISKLMDYGSDQQFMSALCYEIVNSRSDKKFKKILEEHDPRIKQCLDNISKGKNCLISQEAFSTTWRVNRLKIFERLSKILSNYPHKFILTIRNEFDLIKSLYLIRVRDYSTKLPFVPWLAINAFAKNNILEFIDFRSYILFMREKCRENVEIIILDFEKLFFNGSQDFKVYEEIDVRLTCQLFAEYVTTTKENKGVINSNQMTSCGPYRPYLFSTWNPRSENILKILLLISKSFNKTII